MNLYHSAIAAVVATFLAAIVAIVSLYTHRRTKRWVRHLSRRSEMSAYLKVLLDEVQTLIIRTRSLAQELRMETECRYLRKQFEDNLTFLTREFEQRSRAKWVAEVGRNPELKPLVNRFLEASARVAEARQKFMKATAAADGDGGGPATSNAFAETGTALDEIVEDLASHIMVDVTRHDR